MIHFKIQFNLNLTRSVQCGSVFFKAPLIMDLHGSHRTERVNYIYNFSNIIDKVNLLKHFQTVTVSIWK